jgi:hypothetical protein
MENLVHQLENAFIRKGAYEIVGALTKGHTTLGVVVIAVAVIAAVFVFKKVRTNAR